MTDQENYRSVILLIRTIPDISNFTDQDNYRTVICTYYQRGHCKNGSNCTFLHVEKEKKVEFSKKVNQETEKLRQEMFNKIKQESEEEISIVTQIAQEARFIKEVQNFVKVNKDKR